MITKTPRVSYLQQNLVDKPHLYSNSQKAFYKDQHLQNNLISKGEVQEGYNHPNLPRVMVVEGVHLTLCQCSKSYSHI